MAHQSTPRNIQQLLKSSTLLKQCQQQQHEQSIEDCIKDKLAFLNHFPHRCYAFSEDTLGIDIPNAMLRYSILAQEKSILGALQRHYPQFIKLRIHINPKLSR